MARSSSRQPHAATAKFLAERSFGAEHTALFSRAEAKGFSVEILKPGGRSISAEAPVRQMGPFDIRSPSAPRLLRRFWPVRPGPAGHAGTPWTRLNASPLGEAGQRALRESPESSKRPSVRLTTKSTGPSRTKGLQRKPTVHWRAWRLLSHRHFP
jgi:hypothetical protein